MKNLFSLFLLILFFSFLVTGQSQAAGLVPCGGTGEPACQFCHLFVMVKGIWDFVLKVVAVVAALMFIIGGFFLITAGGIPGRVESGKKILTATVIGLVIIFGSWLLISAIFSFPGFINPDFGNGWDLTQWFKVSCTFK